MTTHLPDWLGGHEINMHGKRGDGQVIVTLVDGPNGGLNPTEIHIDPKHLTEVKPSLAESTVDGTFAAVRSEGTKTYAFSRREAVHAAMLPDHPAEYCWWWHDDGSWVRWKDLLEHGDPVLLVEDLAADAPELPYEFRDHEGDRLRVEITSSRTRPVDIWVRGELVECTADEAETVAAAILRAAREARK